MQSVYNILTTAPHSLLLSLLKPPLPLPFSLRSRNLFSEEAEFNARMWPPYQLPAPVDSDMTDPRRVYISGTFHAVIFSYLYKVCVTCDV